MSDAKTPEPIQFYFDFSSPYGYIAAHRIDGVARHHGRTVDWRPILLGPIFKLSGGAPLSTHPIRWHYSLRDFHRTCRLHNLPFALPEKFPFAATAASRAFYWIDHTDPSLAREFAKAIYDGAFAKGLEVWTADGVAAIAAAQGLDRQACLAAIEDPHWKDHLRAITDQAAAAGIFGSPFFIVDGEAFWGNDRIPEVDAWLARGGW